MLLIFSFNDSELPTFPLDGFTLHWYHEFLTNPDLRDALLTSAEIAAISSLGAVVLGILASIALVRHRFRGSGPGRLLVLRFHRIFEVEDDEVCVAFPGFCDGARIACWKKQKRAFVEQV